MKRVSSESIEKMAFPPLRPSRHAEKMLIKLVLEGIYPVGTTLPNERSLAVELGITRPTLRETLHRLAKEGWFTIKHGKSTEVNDYLKTGGMGLLSTLSEHTEYLSPEFIIYLLEVRANLLPVIAGLSAVRAPVPITEYLEKTADIQEEAAAYSTYDWGLQILMARNTGNPVYNLLLNDFKGLFDVLALQYFGIKAARRISRRYYEELHRSILRGGGNIELIVRRAMEKSIEIYRKIKKV